MPKIYIVEEATWDHHENIKVFQTYMDAVNYCNLEYGERADGHSFWSTRSFNYYVEEYEVE